MITIVRILLLIDVGAKQNCLMLECDSEVENAELWNTCRIHRLFDQTCRTASTSKPGYAPNFVVLQIF